MCGSNDFGSACCPPAQIFQEKICGNFLGTATREVFSAPAGDYFVGTFEIFNSASSTASVTGTVTPTVGTAISFDAVPGFSHAEAVKNHTSFVILAPAGTSIK